MVESSPSGPLSARDPDQANSDDTATNGSESESGTGRDEDRWVRAVAALAQRFDPVPDEVLEAARRAHRKPKKSSK